MQNQQKQIVILGGTFDPVHLGHIKLINQVLQKLNLNYAKIIPAKTPPHRGKPFASAADRVAMLKLALHKQKKLELDLREIKRPGKSYMVTTLKSLRKEYGKNAPIILVMASDAFQNFLSWHQYQEILKLANLVIANRPNHFLLVDEQLLAIIKDHAAANKTVFLKNPFSKILFIKIKSINISASQIREQIKNGKNPKKFLDKNVFEYINNKQLYL